MKRHRGLLSAAWKRSLSPSDCTTTYANCCTLWAATVIAYRPYWRP